MKHKSQNIQVSCESWEIIVRNGVDGDSQRASKDKDKTSV